MHIDNSVIFGLYHMKITLIYEFKSSLHPSMRPKYFSEAFLKSHGYIYALMVAKLLTRASFANFISHSILLVRFESHRDPVQIIDEKSKRISFNGLFHNKTIYFVTRIVQKSLLEL